MSKYDDLIGRIENSFESYEQYKKHCIDWLSCLYRKFPEFLGVGHDRVKFFGMANGKVVEIYDEKLIPSCLFKDKEGFCLVCRVFFDKPGVTIEFPLLVKLNEYDGNLYLGLDGGFVLSRGNIEKLVFPLMESISKVIGSFIDEKVHSFFRDEEASVAKLWKMD